MASGFWNNFQNSMDRLLAGGKSARRTGAINLVWVPRTAQQDNVYGTDDPEATVVVPELVRAGWRVNDLQRLSAVLKAKAEAAGVQFADLYWDNLHFQQHVYRSFNELFLMQVCRGLAV